MTISFRPFIIDEEYKKFFANRLYGRREEEVFLDYLTSSSEYEMTMFQRVDLLIGWQHDNRPYYRLYPGVMDFLLKQNPQKFMDLDLHFPFGLETLSVEIPNDYWDKCMFQSAVFCAEPDGGFRTLIQVKDRTYATLDFHKNFNFDEEDWDTWRVSKDFVKTIAQLLIGVIAIGEDPELIKPIVLSKDRQKYEATKDPKYIEKARKRHNFGFDIGHDIPTEEEIKSYLQENKVARPHGRPSPHIRCAYLALRRTGPGGRTPKIVKVKSAFVNKSLLTAVPQGFYKND